MISIQVHVNGNDSNEGDDIHPSIHPSIHPFLRFNRIARAHLEAENESSEHIKMNWSSWVDSLTGEKKKLELTKYRWNLENRSNSTGLPSIEASTTTSFTCHTNNCDSKIKFWLIFKSQEAYLSRWSFLEILATWKNGQKTSIFNIILLALTGALVFKSWSNIDP